MQRSYNQDEFINKIEAYLKSRKRENVLLTLRNKNQQEPMPGLCNGASLHLMEILFYDAMNHYYAKPLHEQTQEVFHELIEKAYNTFFDDINTIISTDDIDLLPNNHIHDIPVFEKFINQTFIFQSPKICGLEQHDLANLFQLIQTENANLPIPKLENKCSLLQTHDELTDNIKKIFPARRLIWLELAAPHTVCAINTGKGYFYYDSNEASQAYHYCKSEAHLILNLYMSVIYAKIVSINNPQNDEAIQAARNLFALRSTLFENESVNISLLLDSAKSFIPAFISMSIASHAHPKETEHYQYSSIIDLHSSQSSNEDLLLREDYCKDTLLKKSIRINDNESILSLLQYLNYAAITNKEKFSILNKKMPLNQRYITPLHYAVIKKNVTATDLLLKHNANPNIADNTGMLPIYDAILFNHFELVCKLIKAGTKFDANDAHNLIMNSRLSNNNKFKSLFLLENINICGTDSLTTQIGMLFKNYANKNTPSLFSIFSSPQQDYIIAKQIAHFLLEFNNEYNSPDEISYLLNQFGKVLNNDNPLNAVMKFAYLLIADKKSIDKLSPQFLTSSLLQQQ